MPRQSTGNGQSRTYRFIKSRRRAKPLRPRLEALEARIVLSDWSGPLTSNTTFVNTQVQNIVGNC
jgi:hypothetical protein